MALFPSSHHLLHQFQKSKYPWPDMRQQKDRDTGILWNPTLITPRPNQGYPRDLQPEAGVEDLLHNWINDNEFLHTEEENTNMAQVLNVLHQDTEESTAKMDAKGIEPLSTNQRFWIDGMDQSRVENNPRLSLGTLSHPRSISNRDPTRYARVRLGQQAVNERAWRAQHDANDAVWHNEDDLHYDRGENALGIISAKTGKVWGRNGFTTFMNNPANLNHWSDGQSPLAPDNTVATNGGTWPRLTTAAGARYPDFIKDTFNLHRFASNQDSDWE